MVIGLFQEDFAQAVRERVSKIDEHVASGGCTSFEQYKAKCGERAGLKQALELFKDVAKRHGELEE